MDYNTKESLVTAEYINKFWIERVLNVARTTRYSDLDTVEKTVVGAINELAASSSMLPVEFKFEFTDGSQKISKYYRQFEKEYKFLLSWETNGENWCPMITNSWSLDGEHVCVLTGNSGSYYEYDLNTFEKTIKSFNGIWMPQNDVYIWTDGEDIYYSNDRNMQQFVYMPEENKWELVNGTGAWNGDVSLPNAAYIWTDGVNIYYSSNTIQAVFDKSSMSWNSMTWGGEPAGIDGRYVWTDGQDIHYDKNDIHYILDGTTWVVYNWASLPFVINDSNMTEAITTINGEVYYLTYRYDKANRSWVDVADEWSSDGAGKPTGFQGGQMFCSNLKKNVMAQCRCVTYGTDRTVFANDCDVYYQNYKLKK